MFHGLRLRVNDDSATAGTSRVSAYRTRELPELWSVHFWEIYVSPPNFLQVLDRMFRKASPTVKDYITMMFLAVLVFRFPPKWHCGMWPSGEFGMTFHQAPNTRNVGWNVGTGRPSTYLDWDLWLQSVEFWTDCNPNRNPLASPSRREIRPKPGAAPREQESCGMPPRFNRTLQCQRTME